MMSKKILIVDDDKGSRRLITEALKGAQPETDLIFSNNLLPGLTVFYFGC